MSVQRDSPQASESFSRKSRAGIEIGLSAVGTAIIFCTSFFGWEPRVWLTVLGILLVQLSLLKLIQRWLPDERRYLSLRDSVDDFLTYVRRLNTAALALQEDDSFENREEFAEILDKMRQEVEYMAQVAGEIGPKDAQPPAVSIAEAA